MNSALAMTMATSTTTHSLSLRESSGISMRITVAAMAKMPKMVPMVDADRPFS